MPLVTTKKGKRFHACFYWEIAMPFLHSPFAQRLIIENDLRGGASLRATNPFVIIGIRDFEDWQMAVYVVCCLMNSIRGVPGHVSRD